MPGLSDAYQNDVGALQGRTRLGAGIALLAIGALLCLAALVVALAAPTDWAARKIAGAIVGLAAPALLGGVVVILPANPRLRAAAAIGASLTVLGVAGFWYAYPSHWLGYGRELTPYVTGIYFVGMLTIAVCLFGGIATFKHRNDPGGTVSLQVGEGETRIVTVERERETGDFGGVGLLGGTPDGDVETQTNDSGGSQPGGTGTGSGSSNHQDGTSTGATSSTRSPSSRSGGTAGLGAGAVSDGGADAEVLESPEPLDEGRDDAGPSLADRYCGNCEHFQYVRTEGGMTPHCGAHAKYMDDMEACEDWSPNAK